MGFLPEEVQVTIINVDLWSGHAFLSNDDVSYLGFMSSRILAPAGTSSRPCPGSCREGPVPGDLGPMEEFNIAYPLIISRLGSSKFAPKWRTGLIREVHHSGTPRSTRAWSSSSPRAIATFDVSVLDLLRDCLAQLIQVEKTLSFLRLFLSGRKKERGRFWIQEEQYLDSIFSIVACKRTRLRSGSLLVKIQDLKVIVGERRLWLSGFFSFFRMQ